MFDFSHLEAEIISHVIAPQVSTSEYLELLKTQSHTTQGRDNKASPEMNTDLEQLTPKSRSLLTLIETAREFAVKCLSNPSRPLEYYLALTISCLGALKYRNLDAHQKHMLYLTAASLLSKIENRDIVPIPG
jgi:hypothetical protein